jgi:hypothetical protein
MTTVGALHLHLHCRHALLRRLIEKPMPTALPFQELRSLKSTPGAGI